jgi:hypothetical protein
VGERGAKNSSNTLENISQASIEHKENFTVHLPLMGQNPPPTTMTEELFQSGNGTTKNNKGQLSPQTIYKLDSQRLHRDESDEVTITRKETDKL